jgi:hypothetical protein
MSSNPSSPKHPSVPRFRVGLLSLVQVVSVIVVFLVLNFLSSQHHLPYDISDDLGFTLAPSTERYLRSEAVRDREAPIRMIVAFRATSPFYEKIRPIAEEYHRLSGGNIELQILDPIRASDAAASLAAEYNLIFNQDMVILDARPRDEREAADGEISPHVHIARLEDMVVHETGPDNQRRVRGFLGEDALRSGLVNAIEGKPRRMWVLTDKSDLTSETYDSVWTILSANLVSQNIVPERVSLSGLDEIPADVEAVAIIAANNEFTAGEFDVLERYWNRPRSSLLVTTGKSDTPPKLRAFLRRHGVTPRDDRVLALSGESVKPSVVAAFTRGMEFNRDLWEKSTLLEGHTRSLEVREGAEDLLSHRIAPYSLLESKPEYWGETRFPAESVSFDPEEDQPGPVPLAAAVIKGTANDARFAGETSRMIVIANSGFLVADQARQANLDFLASASNWLVRREALTGRGPRNLRLYKLPLLEAQVTFINRVNLLVLPAVLLLFGGFSWAGRRA